MFKTSFRVQSGEDNEPRDEGLGMKTSWKNQIIVTLELVGSGWYCLNCVFCVFEEATETV